MVKVYSERIKKSTYFVKKRNTCFVQSTPPFCKRCTRREKCCREMAYAASRPIRFRLRDRLLTGIGRCSLDAGYDICRQHLCSRESSAGRRRGLPRTGIFNDVSLCMCLLYCTLPPAACTSAVNCCAIRRENDF